MSKDYAAAGVDYSKIRPFKKRMQEVVERTRHFSEKRNVFVDGLGCYEYRGKDPHKWKSVTEGLGNKNHLAEWLYEHTGNTQCFEAISLDAMRMALNDVAAFGAMPVVYTDEVATGNSEWFADPGRAKSAAEGFFRGCELDGVALVGGESPSLKYLVKNYPVMSGCAVGIIAPKHRRIDNTKVRPHLCIVGAASNGLHANGASIVIDRGPSLPQGYLTQVPGGRTFIEEILKPTISYVRLVEVIQEFGVPIEGIVPGTGGGVAKLMDAIPDVSFEISEWMAVPPVFKFMQRKFGMSLESCLTTFNWGVGYYLFVSPPFVNIVCEIGEKAGYQMAHLGMVKEGPPQVDFLPEHIVLPPGQ